MQSWQTSTFTAHRGDNLYISWKYRRELRLGIFFPLWELGMPAWSLLTRFEHFNLHNQCNLDFAVEQTRAEILYYSQFCD